MKRSDVIYYRSHPLSILYDSLKLVEIPSIYSSGLPVSNMRAFKLYTATAALVWCQPASSGALPPATGPYHVGLQKHVVPVLNEADPFWPNNVSTSFLVNVFYPTQQEPEPRDWERPYLDPVTARLYEQQFNLTAGSLSTIKSPGLIPDAKPLDYYHHYPDSGSSPLSVAPLPTLFFGPGGGGPMTECYTTLLSDLASYGYTVLAMDHPYEQPFVRYPNGTGILGMPISYAWDEPTALAVQSARVNDSIALLGYLPKLEANMAARSKSPSPFKLNQTHIGIFGHSLGGSAAAAALLEQAKQQRRGAGDERAPSFRAGMNMDGTFFGPAGADDDAEPADVRQPFLMLGFDGHGTRDSASGNVSDSTWPAFASRQKTAYWRWLNVRGARHHDFSDITYWKTLVPELQDRGLGPIGGARLVVVWRAFVRAFFDVVLLGQSGSRALLDAGVNAAWPEKIWVGGGDGVNA